MAITSAAKGYSIENPKEDRKTSVHFGQYRVSDQAIYVPAFPFDQYIPFASVTRVWIQNATMQLTGCCGKTMPLVLVRVQFPGQNDTETQNFTFETQKQADGFLAKITNACPGLITTPPEKPVRGKIL